MKLVKLHDSAVKRVEEEVKRRGKRRRKREVHIEKKK